MQQIDIDAVGDDVGYNFSVRVGNAVGMEVGDNVGDTICAIVGDADDKVT